ncbi:adenylate kinase [Alkalinema sp. FACHB-956]|uniref:adenylate kinase n=1 Tax=Alkalinema sp. FACHB-956 TaxID=2692768 RepID=UPI001682E97A|nr:adenylate kinase [Alkalinema sp. FACHB-956]MBD2325292.1 adenylate kinase [Alkalinema sp. FACHB-956]
MQRIAIVGTTGAGKTTLARRVAELLDLVHVELDGLQWEPDWTPAEDGIFSDRITHALRGNRWVVDGNYSRVRDLIWQQADTIVFLDYSFWVVFGRLLGRTWRRSFYREELWNGNRENFRLSFFSTDSVLWWMVKTYRKRRREYPLLFQRSDYAHLSVVHLTSPEQTEQWCAQLAQGPIAN